MTPSELASVYDFIYTMEEVADSEYMVSRLSMGKIFTDFN
jgi:hypothetical protein